jgi:hypothetical protein
VWPQWRELAEMAYLWDVPHALSGSALRACLGSDAQALTSTPVDIAFRDSLVALGMTSLASSRSSPAHS